MVWETKMGYLSIPITKGLPYGIFMKHIIFEIMENGQLNKLLKKWAVPKPDCRPLHKEGKPLSLEKMISLFIISIIGIFIGFIILIIEKIIHAYKPIQQNSIKESNKMKLQKLFLKLQKTLNDDEVFLESTMKTLDYEIQNHNSLLNDAMMRK